MNDGTNSPAPRKIIGCKTKYVGITYPELRGRRVIIDCVHRADGATYGTDETIADSGGVQVEDYVDAVIPDDDPDEDPDPNPDRLPYCVPSTELECFAHLLDGVPSDDLRRVSTAVRDRADRQRYLAYNALVDHVNKLWGALDNVRIELRRNHYRANLEELADAHEKLALIERAQAAFEAARETRRAVDKVFAAAGLPRRT